MTILNTLIAYVLENWASLGLTIIISSISGISLYRKFDEHVQSARDEKLESARKEIIDLLENRIINDQDIDSQDLGILINSVSRKHELASESLNSFSLLEDVHLRIEEASHLNAEEKKRYRNRIKTIMIELEEIYSNRATRDLDEKLEELKEMVEEERGLEIIEEIKDNYNLSKNQADEDLGYYVGYYGGFLILLLIMTWIIFKLTQLILGLI